MDNSNHLNTDLNGLKQNKDGKNEFMNSSFGEK